jgi:hypothetical protein
VCWFLAAPAAGQVEDRVLSTCRRNWARKQVAYVDTRRGYRALLDETLRTRHWLDHYFRVAPKHALDFIEPTWRCEATERVGGLQLAPLPGTTAGEVRAYERRRAYGDGPKFMCGVDTLQPPCLVYNVGSYNQVGFERALHNLTRCEIHTFDPTLADPYTGGAYSAFHPIALGSVLGTFGTNKGLKGKSLAEIMSELGHTGRRLDVLKVDCEGCEFAAFRPVFEALKQRTLSIGQLLLEVHVYGLKRPEIAQGGLYAFFKEADDAGLRVFSKERNGWGCNGYRCVEFAFVDERQACSAFISTHCAGYSPRDVCGLAS